VVILLNMLIAMMAQSFAIVSEAYLRNYKVMRVQLFVGYMYRGAPAPFNTLSLPFFAWVWFQWFKKERAKVAAKQGAKQLQRRNTFSQDEDIKKLRSFFSRGAQTSDLPSLVPVDDGTISNNVITKWNNNKPVSRELLPVKTLNWIDKLTRLCAPAMEDTGLHDDEGDADDQMINKATTNKKEVEKLLSKHIRATVKANTEGHTEKFAALLDEVGSLRAQVSRMHAEMQARLPTAAGA